MPKELRHKVSESIKKARTKIGLTQEQLSESSGVGYKYLQEIEGKNPPNISLKTIEKLSKALNVPASKLLTSK